MNEDALRVNIWSFLLNALFYLVVGGFVVTALVKVFTEPSVLLIPVPAFVIAFAIAFLFGASFHLAGIIAGIFAGIMLLNALFNS